MNLIILDSQFWLVGLFSIFVGTSSLVGLKWLQAFIVDFGCFGVNKFPNAEKLVLDCEGRVTLPKRMNFQKSSKRPLTPPSFSENHVTYFL